LSQAKFKFVSDATGGDQFTVVSFTGRERVSELYRYEIEVKAPLSANIDLDDVLDGLVHFVTEQNGVEFPVNGILSSFEEFKTVQNFAHYKAILVPSIWKLSNYKTNEIFYQAGDEGDIDAGLTITDIITQVLEKSGMTSADFDLGGLSSKLLKREYTCQYGESDFDFISRLLENEGVFYYFEQSATEEKIVFVNDLNYLSLPRPKLIFDVAAMANSQDNCVFGWSCRKQRLAERVVVRNYNPEEPSLDVSDTTAIDSRGQGTEYIYGQNVQTDTEATYLSQIRAEEQICRKTQFFGESSVSRLQAGYLFLLEQHPNTKYNASEYLAIEVNHEGHNLDMSIAHDANKKTRPQYQNSFVAISANVQYRPPLKTIKPRITGTLHARIDGELLSEYAQLDSQGRYKVSMPFDFHNDDHPEGLASARVRMMQPYAGKGRGMQFPMAKGTEVLLTFVDGDPDRPLIAGAINTAAAPGPVTAGNQTESVIQTGGNNKIRMEDKFGSERLMLESPASNSWIRVGAKNDPIVLNGHSPVYLPNDGSFYQDPYAYSHAEEDESVTTNPNIVGVVTDSTGTELSGGVDTNTLGQYFITYTDNTDGTTADTAIRQVFVYDPALVDDLEIPEGTSSDGIRIRSAGNLWFEAQSRYGQYHSGIPVKGPTNGGNGPSEIGDLIANFGFNYAPTNLKNHNDPITTQTVAQAIASAHVHVSSLDTFTTQEGNIYDFGGYWNYNLGNSYAEDHVDQKAELNKDATDFNNAQVAYKGAKREVERLRSWNDPDASSLQYYPDLLAAENLKTSTKATRDGLTDIKGDLLDAGGPVWRAVNWPTAKPKVGNQDSDTRLGDGGSTINNDLTAGDTKLEGSYWTDNQGEGKVWVQKKWGNDYEYHQGDAISVSLGSSLDVQHGGRHVEVNYRGDDESTIASWSHSEGGISREKKWTSAGTMIYESRTESTGKFINELEKKYDRNTGDLYSHTHSQGTGMGLAKFEFDYSNTVALTVNSGSLLSSETFLGAKITNENYIGVAMSMGTFLGGKIDMEFALAGIIEIRNTKVGMEFPGTSIEATGSKIDTVAADLKTIGTSLNAMGAKINAGTTDIEAIAAVKLTA
jgi:type VI secretion system VgrG family protein